MERLTQESSLLESFEQLQNGFQRSAERSADDIEDSYYVFGGHVVRLRITSRYLAQQIARPFAHLRIDGTSGGAPSLDIRISDETSRCHCDKGAPSSDQLDVEECTEISDTGRFVQQRTPHGFISLDRRTAQIVGTIASSVSRDVYQRGKPLARLLAEWYADQGVAVIHAGLVSRAQEGVLLAGKSGSGKSTLALACAREGLGFLSEDYTALEFHENGSVLGHSAYNSVFVTSETATWFPELRRYLTDSRDGRETKSVVLLWDVWPSRLLTCVRIRAVALCQLTDSASFRIRPASRPEALLAVAPSSLLQIHGRRTDSLDRLARLVESVPCYWLELGRDLQSAPSSIDEILSRVASQTERS